MLVPPTPFLYADCAYPHCLCTRGLRIPHTAWVHADCDAARDGPRIDIGGPSRISIAARNHTDAQEVGGARVSRGPVVRSRAALSARVAGRGEGGGGGKEQEEAPSLLKIHELRARHAGTAVGGWVGQCSGHAGTAEWRTSAPSLHRSVAAHGILKSVCES